MWLKLAQQAVIMNVVASNRGYDQLDVRYRKAVECETLIT
jgi:hypothetical protein